MNVWVEWVGNPSDRILRHVFVGNWTTAEYLASLAQAVEMTKAQAPAPVYHIVDMTQTNTIPPDITRSVKHTGCALQNNTQVIIVVDICSPGAHFLGLFSRFVPHITRRLRLVDDLQQAFRFIHIAQLANGDHAHVA